MSQFNKYIKIATEIINEENEPDMDKKLRLLVNIIKKYTELIEKEIIDANVVINDIVKGSKEDGKYQMLGFVSDFNITPNNSMINAGRSAALNQKAIEKENNLYYKGKLQLTETLANKLKVLDSNDLEEYLKALENLENVNDFMKKIGKL